MADGSVRMMEREKWPVLSARLGFLVWSLSYCILGATGGEYIVNEMKAI
jgi:hypothetical protein